MMGSTVPFRVRSTEFVLDEEAFTAHLARLRPEHGTAGCWDDERFADLALAFACAAGSPRASTAFVARFGSVLDAIACAGSRRDDPEDLRQLVLEHILVGSSERPPRIAGFRGDSSLVSWVRTVARRYCIDRQRQRRAPTPAELRDALCSELADPELELLKQRYASQFTHAVQGALASLGAQEKVLMQQLLVQRWGSADIARFHGVHRATAKRWLASLRRRLLRRTRAVMLDALRLRSDELDSILRLIQSRLDGGLEQLCGATP